MVKRTKVLPLAVAIVAIVLAYLSYLGPEEAVFCLSDLLNSLDTGAEENTKYNKFLQGNYAPVADEMLDIPLSLVSGELPQDLSGLFLRVGANPFPHHRSRRYHWFDGHGMIHSVRVKDGEVRYSNQWINTPKFEIEKKFDRNVFLQLGEFFGFVGLLKILFLGPMLLSVFKLKPVEVGAANTAMLLYNNRLYACYESSLLFEIKWHANNSFSSIGYDSFEGAMDFPVTAHSKVDPVDGGMYINSYMPSTDSSGNNMKVAVVKGRTVEANYGFKLPTVSWAHDMSMTENYILILDSSVHFDRNGIMTGAFFDMDNNHKFRVGAAPKTAHSADEIVWFTADQPYAIVHTLNAWEEVTVEGDREIVLWASLSDSWQGHSLNSTEHFDQSELRMSFATGRMQVNKLNALSNGGVEFPRVHPQYIGRRTKYGYAGGFPMVGDARVSQILKINTDSQEVEATISFPEGKYSSEPVPFPKGEETGVGSDEVFISVFIFDENTQTSEWHLYDGQSMDTSPVVAYSVPRRVPYGFHGLWLTEKELQDHMIA